MDQVCVAVSAAPYPPRAQTSQLTLVLSSDMAVQTLPSLALCRVQKLPPWSEQ